MKIWKCNIVEENNPKEPGRIIKVNKEGIYVSTGGGVLLIQEIQLPNSRKMTVNEYIRGNSLESSILLGE